MSCLCLRTSTEPSCSPIYLKEHQTSEKTKRKSSPKSSSYFFICTKRNYILHLTVGLGDTVLIFSSVKDSEILRVLCMM